LSWLAVLEDLGVHGASTCSPQTFRDAATQLAAAIARAEADERAGDAILQLVAA